MPLIYGSFLLLVIFYASVTAIIVPDDFLVTSIPVLETQLNSDQYCIELFPGQDNVESCYGHYTKGLSNGKFSCCDKRKADHVHSLGQMYVIGKFSMRCDETRYMILYKGDNIILFKRGPKKGYKLRCDLYSDISAMSLLKDWLGKKGKKADGVTDRTALISLADHETEGHTSLWTNIICVDSSSSDFIKHSKID